MTTGTLTFGSLANLSQYRTNQTTFAKQGQGKVEPTSPVSSQIPTGNVDSRTDQALIWSGLKTAASKNDSLESSFFSKANSSSSAGRAAYQAPNLDLAYSFASIKGILAYRDALIAKTPEAANSLGQNLSQKS